MTPESVGRAASQTYYDMALRDPVMVLGGSTVVGEPIKEFMLDPEGHDWSSRFRDAAAQYLKDSVVSHNPQAAAVGLCRLAATLHYVESDPYGT